MRRIILSLVLGIVGSLLATGQSMAGGAPATPWQFTIKGQDRGVMFVTFVTDTPPTNTATGYGISLDAGGPFAFTGTWYFNADNDIACGFIQTGAFDTFSGNFVTKSPGNGGLIAKASTSHGPQKFKAPQAGPIADLSGSWAGEIKSRQLKGLDSFTLTPATNNMPGWFDLVGTGISESGSFTLTGAVLVTTDRNAAGYTISNFGTATTQAAYVGRINRRGDKLILRGRDADSQSVTFRAEQPKTK
jgi:hypothetical protein